MNFSLDFGLRRHHGSFHWHFSGHFRRVRLLDPQVRDGRIVRRIRIGSKDQRFRTDRKRNSTGFRSGQPVSRIFVTCLIEKIKFCSLTYADHVTQLMFNCQLLSKPKCEIILRTAVHKQLMISVEC